MRSTQRYSFRDRTVLVTGGTRGLGLALARRFLAEGASVAVCGRDADTLEQARRDLVARASESRVFAEVCDVGDAAAVDGFVSAVADRFGPVDVLVNNAGLITVGPESAMALADYERVMRVNLWGAMHTIRAVLPGMRARGAGRIVNIASIGGRISVPHLLPYGVSKFALVGLSEGLRAELRHHGVKVTTVCPGLMRTGSPRHADFKGRHRGEYAWFSVADSLPGLSVSTEYAARRIVEAARSGRASLTFPITARAAAAAAELAPNLTAAALDLTTRLLPRWGRGPNALRKGRESETAVTRSWLTTLGRRAAGRYNQVEEYRMGTSNGESRFGGRNVGGMERVLSVAAGAVMIGAGLRRGRAARAVLVPMGTALIGRGATGHCPVNRAIGRNSAGPGHTSPVASVARGEGIKVERSVIIDRPRAELYTFWRNFENLPRFMRHLEAVEVIDAARSRWRAKGPAGSHVEWDAVIHNEIPNELIAWRSVGDPDVNNAGSVHFRDLAGGRGTEVRVVLSYQPPAGRIGATIARLFGEEPSHQVEDDLRRFRDLMEAGEPARRAQEPVGTS